MSITTMAGHCPPLRRSIAEQEVSQSRSALDSQVRQAVAELMQVTATA
ncbi:MAG TPA: hypothetical protein VNX00_06485 [Herbaspirillum sp.]|nr:hypothetical protein [Herbaspirillum sp.]